MQSEASQALLLFVIIHSTLKGSKHLETIKALGLRPRTFICFSVFGS